MAQFKNLKGKTLRSIQGGVGQEVMTFVVSNTEMYELYHIQDCCENVRIEDICGDLADLVGIPIVHAEKVQSPSNTGPVPHSGYCDSYTWTFYKLATNRGSVTIRWLGESNGYYSEGVDFRKI